MSSTSLLIRGFVRSIFLGSLALTMLCSSSRARAQTDKAAAEALFREGMRLAKSGNYAEACPKLEESQRVEPSLGVQYYLADCFERIGRSASAWANFVEVANKAQLAGETAKEQAARERADALEPRLARLKVEVEKAQLPGLSVARGQVLIGPGQWGVAVPVDPGSYELHATAPGYTEWKKTVAVTAGAAVDEMIPALQPLPAASASTTSVSRPLPVSAVTPPLREPASSWGTQRTVAIVVTGVGIAALATGGVLALLANSANKSSKNPGKCLPDDTCTGTGLDARDKALKFADAATVVSITGAALAAGGAVIWLTAPSSHRESSAGVSARLEFGPSRLVLQGQF